MENNNKAEYKREAPKISFQYLIPRSLVVDEEAFYSCSASTKFTTEQSACFSNKTFFLL